ncbi:MAG: alpha/beta hydrolase [Rikenellaceae bacterium]|nr:alpha/beta hydrolase [Rikenellaceae bacterium]
MKKVVFLFIILFGCVRVMGQERIVTTTDSVRLYVKVKGSGPYLLYLHGGPGSGSYWLENFSGEFFERHFTMVYLDQRGVGRSSSPPDGNYSMDRMAADFEQVRQELHIDRWLTLGHSFGGILQMGYIERCPASVEGMIMLNNTLSLNDSFENGWLKKTEELLQNEDCAFLHDDSLSGMDKLAIAAGRLQEKNISWKIFYASPESEVRLNRSFSELAHFNNDFSGNFARFPEYFRDYRPATSGIGVPVLFFYGRNDWSVGPEHYKGVHFPNMILWGSDVGHMPFLENCEDMEHSIEVYLTRNGFVQ